MGRLLKVVAIVQARMNSSWFPGKVMKRVAGMTIIELLLRRLRHSKMIDAIVVATSQEPENLVLMDHIKDIGFMYATGSETDVLSRYFNVASKFQADLVVRITGDCPIIDPAIVDQCIEKSIETGTDYCSNILPPTFPDGLDVEVIKFSALDIAHQKATAKSDREHVTPFIRKSNTFKKRNLEAPQDLSSCRWTVDESVDLEVMKNVFDYFAPNIHFSWQDVVDLHEAQPKLFELNSKLKRNEGAIMGKGQKLWERAKKVIPGGNMLLSKRPEMYLPDYWPTYYSKSQGCRVWDMEGKEYIDMAAMGVGTNILGYSHPEVDEAVIRAVRSGNMSTLNCEEELLLAEKLTEIHPWADMARFARSGGEANAIAVRIARAYAGKQKVAFCGYHGWHDWYLSANLKK